MIHPKTYNRTCKNSLKWPQSSIDRKVKRCLGLDETLLLQFCDELGDIGHESSTLSRRRLSNLEMSLERARKSLTSSIWV